MSKRNSRKKLSKAYNRIFYQYCLNKRDGASLFYDLQTRREKLIQINKWNVFDTREVEEL